jgi:hypothetical protein
VTRLMSGKVRLIHCFAYRYVEWLNSNFLATHTHTHTHTHTESQSFIIYLFFCSLTYYLIHSHRLNAWVMSHAISFLNFPNLSLRLYLIILLILIYTSFFINIQSFSSYNLLFLLWIKKRVSKHKVKMNNAGRSWSMVGETRNAYKHFWLGNLKEREHIQDFGIGRCENIIKS